MFENIIITLPRKTVNELDGLAAHMGLPRDIVAAKVLGMTLPALNKSGCHTISVDARKLTPHFEEHFRVYMADTD